MGKDQSNYFFLEVCVLYATINFATCATINIIPSTSSCPGQPCMTIQAFAANSNLRGTNTTLLVQPGIHMLSRSMTVSNADGFTMSSTAGATIQCSGAYQITISSVAHIQISGLTFLSCGRVIYGNSRSSTTYISGCNFTSNRAGAVYMSGLLHLSHSSFFYNYGGSAVGANSANIAHCNFVGNNGDTGGAVSGGRITIRDSNFTSNVARRVGGALYINTLTLMNTNFVNNTAMGSAGGGAVEVGGGYEHSLSVSQSTFINNTATNGNGGAILHLFGPPTLQKTLTVNQSIFINNTAPTGSGGAIHAPRPNTLVSIVHSTFSYNSALCCGVLDGDALVNDTVDIISSTFTFNQAAGEFLGGGVACVRNNASVNVISSTFSHNRAEQHAGVFYIEHSMVAVEGSTFNNNSARVDGGVMYTSAHPTIYNIKQSTFSENTAGDDGGVMFVGRAGSEVGIGRSTLSYSDAADRGGAIFIVSSTLRITESNIISNTANFGGTISACNSNVTVSSDLSSTTDSTLPLCTLYDGSINRYDITQDIVLTTSTSVPPLRPSTFHIITSSSSTCEFSGEPCITLEQFASNPYQRSPNITLVLEPGIHSLRSHLSVSTGYNFTMFSTNATIQCVVTNPGGVPRITISSVDHIHMTGIRFENCGQNIFGRPGISVQFAKVSFTRCRSTTTIQTITDTVSLREISIVSCPTLSIIDAGEVIVTDSTFLQNSGPLSIENTRRTKMKQHFIGAMLEQAELFIAIHVLPPCTFLDATSLEIVHSRAQEQ